MRMLKASPSPRPGSSGMTLKRPSERCSPTIRPPGSASAICPSSARRADAVVQVAVRLGLELLGGGVPAEQAAHGALRREEERVRRLSSRSSFIVATRP